MAKTGKDGGMISRRAVMKGMAVGAAAIAAPAIIPGGLRKARAEAGVIRMMGGPTVALQDWTLFEKETGLKMEFTPFHVDDVGALYNEILVNDAGERFDLINTLAGVQRNLVTQGAVAQLDPSKLKNYAGIADTVKRSPVLYTGGDKTGACPLLQRRPSATFGEARPAAPAREAHLGPPLNDERTRARPPSTATSSPHDRRHVPEEPRPRRDQRPGEHDRGRVQDGDRLPHRAQEGRQFRSLWKTYDEQVANFMNGESRPAAGSRR